MTCSLRNSEFCFPRLGKHRDFRSGNKIHCSPRDQSLSVNYSQAGFGNTIVDFKLALWMESKRSF